MYFCRTAISERLCLVILTLCFVLSGIPFYLHHDIKIAKVMLFAADTIPPLQELSYDYGYVLDSVARPDGTIISFLAIVVQLDAAKDFTKRYWILTSRLQPYL